MKRKKQFSNKKKKARAKKRIVIFETYASATINSKKVYFSWNYGNKEPQYPEKMYKIEDLITGETIKVVSLSGRTLMERCYEKQGIYIISVKKQRDSKNFIPNSVKPNTVKKLKDMYPEFLL